MTTVGVLAHREKRLGGGLEELRAVLEDSGFADAPWREVSKSKKAPKEVRRLLHDGVDRLLVWGGDGTVRRCIDTIVAEDATTEIGILPAGTANLLARGLDIPIDLDDAVEVGLHGVARRIDVGMINGEAFAVMAGTGFDALLIRDADDMKDRLGRLSYVRAGLRNLANSGGEVKIRVDGDEWFEGRAACVLIANLGRILGGIEVFPDARCDDGLLEVGVLTARTRTDWLRVGARALVGRIDSSPMVKSTRGRRLRVRLDRAMPWELDGGDRPRAKKFDVTVLHRRIPLCVPSP